jgi:hypothetical protein
MSVVYRTARLNPSSFMTRSKKIGKMTPPREQVRSASLAWEEEPTKTTPSNRNACRQSSSLNVPLSNAHDGSREDSPGTNPKPKTLC